MVGWFYINDEVAAPLRMLEVDEKSGILTIEVASRFIPNRTMLRGRTIIEYRNWDQRRLARCLGAERVGNALMIEAVDVGPANVEHDDQDSRGPAEDWLTVNGRAYCKINNLNVNEQTQGHCLFHVGLADWRDLRIGEGAPLASVGITVEAGQDNDGSITPLLHSARERSFTHTPPEVEIVRLRERQRLCINPVATDWGEASTLVVARVNTRSSLCGPSKTEPAVAR
jgi:hypothetical protein